MTLNVMRKKISLFRDELNRLDFCIFISSSSELLLNNSAMATHMEFQQRLNHDRIKATRHQPQPESIDR